MARNRTGIRRIALRPIHRRPLLQIARARIGSRSMACHLDVVLLLILVVV